MEKSPSIANLAVALCAFQAEMPPLTLDEEVEVKTRTGSTYKFKFASMPNINRTSKPILSKHGLSYSQVPESDGSVTTILMHKSGEYIQGNLLIKGEETPQGIGSSLTYTKRYSLTGILGIVAEGDDDGNIAQGNTFKTKKPTAASTNNTFNINSPGRPEKPKEEPPKEKPKPTLTNKQIEGIAKRIQNGENDLLGKVKKAYALTESQLRILEGVVKYIQIEKEISNQPNNETKA